MKSEGLIKNKNTEISFRAGLITAYILICLFLAIYFMGKVYNAIELTAFGNQTEFLQRVGTDEYVVFGKNIYFPIVSYTEKVCWFIKAYSPGIIKLLHFGVCKIEELIVFLIYCF